MLALGVALKLGTRSHVAAGSPPSCTTSVTIADMGDGTVKVVDLGVWIGSPYPTFTYLWFESGSNTGVSTDFFTFSSGSSYVCHVTGTNTYGFSEVPSNQFDAP